VKIVVIDDEADIRNLLVTLLKPEGHQVEAAADGKSGLKLIAKMQPDLALVDLMLPDTDGIAVTREALKSRPDLIVIMITAHGSIDNAVEAMKAGAYHYQTKPFNLPELRLVVKKAGERSLLLAENRILKSQLRQIREGEDYLTKSPAVRAILDEAKKVAGTDSTVLITGEHGTGKEVLAKYIRNHSPRAEKRFVVVNCSALSEQLLESELFGHAKGAFTGAQQDHVGYFEAADGGTIFLDEIGEVSPAIQVKLLRVLQEKEFIRVGETQIRSADVRVIAATNRDIKKLVEEGGLREDFYYRLNVFNFHLPPLKDRPEDILFYFQLFMAEFAAQMGVQEPSVPKMVRDILMKYGWPGNIRELRNLAERTTILSEGNELTPELLPAEFRPSDGDISGGSADFKTRKREFEIGFITDQLIQNKGNIEATARQIGMHPVALRQKVAKLGIDSGEIKARFK
jgi:DNA-binding NtrC family response regulator